MGNCLNAASKQRRGGLLPEEEESLSEMRRISQLLREEEEEDDAYEAEYPEEADEEEAAPAAEGLKVKVVLTRAELEWLMAQLKSGDRRLQDVLHHMHAAKAAADKQHPGGEAWRPRLESILECQETALVT